MEPTAIYTRSRAAHFQAHSGLLEAVLRIQWTESPHHQQCTSSSPAEWSGSCNYKLYVYIEESSTVGGGASLLKGARALLGTPLFATPPFFTLRCIFSSRNQSQDFFFAVCYNKQYIFCTGYLQYSKSVCTENEGVHCVFSRIWSEGGGTMKGRIFRVSHLVAAAICSQLVRQSVSQSVCV